MFTTVCTWIIIYRSQVSAWIQNKSHPLRPEDETRLIYLSSLKPTNYLLVQHTELYMLQINKIYWTDMTAWRSRVNVRARSVIIMCMRTFIKYVFRRQLDLIPLPLNYSLTLAHDLLINNSVLFLLQRTYKGWISVIDAAKNIELILNKLQRRFK